MKETNNHQRTFLVMLSWVVLTTLVALTQTAFTYPGQKERPIIEEELTQTAFTYQGQLKDGSMPASGAYDFQFKLYTAQSGGHELGSLVHENVVLTDGSFTVPLDFGHPAFDAKESWLEIAVRPSGSMDTYTALSPRQRLTPTPYAILAQAESWSLIGVPVGFARGVDSDVVTVDKIADNAVTSAKIADGQVVKSINSLKDDVRLTAGENVTITPDGNTLTIAAQDVSGWTHDKGVVRLTTDTNNVGIGIKEPTAKLDVDGSIRARGPIRSGNSMTFNGLDHTITATDVSGQSFSKQIRIGFSNTPSPNPANFWDIQIGIGTLTPSRPVDIFHNNQASVRLTSGTNPFGSVLELKSNVVSPPPATYLGAINFVQSNDNAIGQIGYLGANAMTFRTNNAERVRIDANGNVGIGTVSPGGPAAGGRNLEVAGGIRVGVLGAPTAPVAGNVLLCRNGNNDLSTCPPGLGGGGNAWLLGGNSTGTTPPNNILGPSSGGDPLVFVAGSLAPKMSILTNGNVGIGTQTPGFKLDVVGNPGGLARFDSPGNTVLIVEGTNLNAQGVINTGIHQDVSTTGATLQLGFVKGEGADRHINFRMNDTSIMTVRGNTFRVGVMTPNPQNTLDVNGGIRAVLPLAGPGDPAVRYDLTTGDLKRDTSDARLKANVTQLTNALEKLDDIRGVSFEWNKLAESIGTSSGHREIGVIAQEVEQVFPELVFTSSGDGYKGVDYSRLTAVLIEAVKELKAENEALKQRIERLEKTTAKR